MPVCLICLYIFSTSPLYHDNSLCKETVDDVVSIEPLPSRSGIVIRKALPTYIVAVGQPWHDAGGWHETKGF
ncbi:hypothetical protein F4809DRAFT_600700 [Biscogniauxia mediterranea]|nr:hypothetical protein F4809DRAFT_600700 [Biscogniauxia mediterranea]